MLKVIKPEAILDNPFKLIGKDQMLITACTKKFQMTEILLQVVRIQ